MNKYLALGERAGGRRVLDTRAIQFGKTRGAQHGPVVLPCASVVGTRSELREEKFQQEGKES